MILIGFLLAASSSFGWAAPIQYQLDKAASTLAFSYVFSGDVVTGEFVDYDADIAIDFDRIANSTVDVRLDTTRAKGGFAFGTQAMRGARVLDAQRFPDITFQSQSITGGGNRAIINGTVTVRGITRPLTLIATLFRAEGTQATERDNLTLKIAGTLNRHDFEASGYPEYVGDTLSIAFDTKIQRK